VFLFPFHSKSVSSENETCTAVGTLSPQIETYHKKILFYAWKVEALFLDFSVSKSLFYSVLEIEGLELFLACFKRCVQLIAKLELYVD